MSRKASLIIGTRDGTDPVYQQKMLDLISEGKNIGYDQIH